MVKIKSSFGAFEAKTHFSDLLDRVERGDRITITRHGRVVATLAPANPKVRKDLLKLGREALAITAGTTLPKGMSLKDVVNAGARDEEICFRCFLCPHVGGGK